MTIDRIELCRSFLCLCFVFASGCIETGGGNRDDDDTTNTPGSSNGSTGNPTIDSMLDMAARRLKEGADPTTVQGEVLAAAATDDQIVATSYDAQGIIGVQLADGQQHLIQIVGAPDAATTEEEAAIFDIDDLGDAEQLSAEIAAQLDELGGPRDIPDDIVAAVNAQRVAARVSGPILTDRAEFVLPKTRYAAIVSTSSVATALRNP